MNTTEVILYVADQRRAADFYTEVLQIRPTLEVPGMTELDLGGATLGLMPVADIEDLVPGVRRGTGQRAELYLRRPDAAQVLDRVETAGGRLLSPLTDRPWGERVGYSLDPDGHVLAVAQA